MYLFDYAFTRRRSVSTSLILDTCQEPGGGGWTPIWNRRECSSEILNLTPKGDHLGVA